MALSWFLSMPLLSRYCAFNFPFPELPSRTEIRRGKLCSLALSRVRNCGAILISNRHLKLTPQRNPFRSCLGRGAAFDHRTSSLTPWNGLYALTVLNAILWDVALASCQHPPTERLRLC